MSHYEGDYVHGSPVHTVFVVGEHFLFHFFWVDPVVGEACVDFFFAADEGA